MNARIKESPPRFFVGDKLHPNGWPVYPVYDRTRIDGRESFVFAWVPVLQEKYDADAKLDAEAIAAALNTVRP